MSDKQITFSEFMELVENDFPRHVEWGYQLCKTDIEDETASFGDWATSLQEWLTFHNLNQD